MRSSITICAAAALVVAGCAQLTRMTWNELQAFATVSFGDPRRENGKLIIPVEFEQKNVADSYSVIEFRGHVEGDMILVTASHLTGDTARANPHEIIVPLPRQPASVYRLVYRSPDGSRRELQKVAVPTRENP